MTGTEIVRVCEVDVVAALATRCRTGLLLLQVGVGVAWRTPNVFGLPWKEEESEEADSDVVLERLNCTALLNSISFL